MTGAARRHLHAPLRPALPARQALRRLDRRSVRPARQHANGHGARLVAVIWHAGIGFTLIRICEGTRHTERAIKNAGGAVRYCPACTPRPWNGHWQADARRLHPPHLPQPRRKAVTPMPNNRTALAATSATTPTSSKSCSSSSTAPRQASPGGGAPNCSPSPFIAAALLAARHLDHPHLGRHHPGRAPGRGLRRAALPPVHHPARLVRAGPAPPPKAVLRSPAAHPLRAAPAHSVDPADQGRRTHLGAVPRGHLRRGLRRPHRRAARRLLRPRRAGHPQPPLVPPDHHRHHPPRHPRGPRDHHLPAGAADRALPHRPARTGPPHGLSPDEGEPAA